MAREIGEKVARRTDMRFCADPAEKQGSFLAKMGRRYTPREVAKMAMDRGGGQRGGSTRA